jgi:Ca2+/H+ antiporter, TMEM165/GDT1 family
VDAFLFSLVACFAAGWGERSQLLVALVAARRGRPGAALLGFAAAAAAICAIAATGAALLQGELTATAEALMIALAFAFAGVMGLFAPPPPGRAARFRGGAFLTAALFGFAFLSGGRAQLLVFAFALRAEIPAAAALGGAAGMVLAAAPAAMFGKAFLAANLRPVRLGLAALFLIAAAWVLLATL